ncbi:MAG: ThuA domain-containing protein [Lachnospiraceae bacterium]|nr:ThuA domain-containing protein [Lachnospiraceae bacterium]
MINVTIWNENLHEQREEAVREVYPDGIHGCIAQFLSYDEDIRIHMATFDEPEHGLTQEILDETDVLIYWSHIAQAEFSDMVAERIRQAVLNGMGLIALHSAHDSKMMKKLLGTSMTLKWRHGDRERLFVTAPSHPIAQYIPEYIELPVEEMYGEYFDIPKPDDVVFTGWFAGGEVFRSGCTFTRGLGKIFYFQPGHEMYPTYYDKYIQRIITNAVHWCTPTRRLRRPLECQEVKMTPEEISGYAAKARRESAGEAVMERTQSGAGASGTVQTSASGQAVRAAQAGATVQATETQQKPRKIKLSIFYEHLREAMEQTGKSFEELLGEAKKAGIQGVEMEFTTLVQHPELNRIIQNAGMEISNLYQFFDFGNKYAAGMHTGRKMIDMAKAMGISRVMIIPGFLAPEKSRELNRLSASFEDTAGYMEGLAEILAMRDAMAELTEYAKERGIMVSIEDFDGFTSPIARTNQIKWFLSQVPDLRHTLDMGNYAFSNENAEEAFETFRGQIGHVHCKDRGEEKEVDPMIWEELGLPMGEELIHRRGIKPVPVGEGYLPIASMVKKLRDEGYEGYMAIEHFGAPDQLGFMLRSAEFLKALLEE